MINFSILCREDIATATREELVVLLEGDFSIQCYDHESTDVLREAAYQNWDTEFKELNDDDHIAKGIVDYNYIREDYLVPIPEAAVVVHPDAMYIWDSVLGMWVPCADVWKVGGTLRPNSIAAGSGAAGLPDEQR